MTEQMVNGKSSVEIRSLVTFAIRVEVAAE